MSVAVVSAQSPPPPPPPAAPQVTLVGRHKPPPEVRVSVDSTRGHGVSHDDRFDEIVSGLDASKLSPVVPGSFEAQVVAGVVNSTGNPVRLHLQDPDRPAIRTFNTSDEGDVLLARWNAADPSRPERATWLWNTPYWDIFIMEVDPVVLRADQLTRYCEGLFVWDGDLIDLRSLTLTYRSSEPGKQDVFGRGEYVQTERAIYSLWLTALAKGDRAYIGVNLSKSITAGDPPGGRGIKERFPPLSERVLGWSRDTLLEEIGKDFSLEDRRRGYPVGRDAIILTELLSRGRVSDAEVRRIVIGGFDLGDVRGTEVIGRRVSAFLEALESRNELPVYAPSLASALLGAPLHPLYAEIVVGRVLAAMNRHGIDFSKEALSFLERGQYTRESLSYLESHVQDADTLRAVERIPVPPELEDNKQFALKTIRERLGVPVNDR